MSYLKEKCAFQQKILRLSLISIMTRIDAVSIVTLLKVLLWAELILEFRGRIQHNQGILPW